MHKDRNIFLIIGATLSAVAALLHFGCIIFGATWYRFLGAGEQMAQLAQDGHWYPTVATSIITTTLLLWALYALSGAGAIRRLPFVRTALCLITAIYLLRGIAFKPLTYYIPDNSALFWVWSSAISFAIGLVHLVGLKQVWGRLRLIGRNKNND